MIVSIYMTDEAAWCWLDESAELVNFNSANLRYGLPQMIESYLAGKHPEVTMWGTGQPISSTPPTPIGYL